MVAALLGMLTGIGGGMVRDVLVGEIPTVLRKDLYALAALAGAGLVVAGPLLHLPTYGGHDCRGRIVLCGSSRGDPPWMGAAYGGWSQLRTTPLLAQHPPPG